MVQELLRAAARSEWLAEDFVGIIGLVAVLVAVLHMPGVL